jgi:DNA repair exonuclease SbcCD ATPase subunit
MAVNDLIEKQLLTLQEQVATLLSEIHGMKSACAVKHRLNLTAEISELENRVKSLEECTDDIDQLLIDYAELTGKYNIIQLKLEGLIDAAKQNKENRTNLITQIVVAVVAAAVTGLLGVFGTLTWMGLRAGLNDNSLNTPPIYINQPAQTRQEK